jgi:hypothetical protein
MPETLAYALERLGDPVQVAASPAPRAASLVVVEVQAPHPKVIHALPPSAILYNLEPLPSQPPPWLTPVVLSAYRGCRVLDYGGLQTIWWTGLRMPAQWVPVGYVPELTQIAPAANQDIDVLFYGTPNPRRLRVLEALKAAGLRVAAAFGVCGLQRDALIARAKLVLNVHYYDPMPVFEVVRVSYLSANRKVVVAEHSPDTDVEPDLRDAVRLAPYEGLVILANLVLHAVLHQLATVWSAHGHIEDHAVGVRIRPDGLTQPVHIIGGHAVVILDKGPKASLSDIQQGIALLPDAAPTVVRQHQNFHLLGAFTPRALSIQIRHRPVQQVKTLGQRGDENRQVYTHRSSPRYWCVLDHAMTTGGTCSPCRRGDPNSAATKSSSRPGRDPGTR